LRNDDEAKMKDMIILLALGRLPDISLGGKGWDYRRLERYRTRYTWWLAGCLIERAGLASIIILGCKTYIFTFRCICHIYLKIAHAYFPRSPFSRLIRTALFYLLLIFFSPPPSHLPFWRSSSPLLFCFISFLQ
jgi:hypothetical protein